jgi:hypothetical protein
MNPPLIPKKEDVCDADVSAANPELIGNSVRTPIIIVQTIGLSSLRF